jgi:hypothetical protein
MVRTTDESLDRIGRAMMFAWGRVKKAQTRMWGDWMIIGDGLLEGRRWAMNVAGTNRPEGKAFVLAMSEWLKRYHVHDMDASDRAKLIELALERPAVEEWRATLSDYERRSLNNPVVVWRKWTAATRVRRPKSRPGQVSAREHGRAQTAIDELQARNSELEQELETAKGRPDRKEREDDLVAAARTAREHAETVLAQWKRHPSEELLAIAREAVLLWSAVCTRLEEWRDNEPSDAEPSGDVDVGPWEAEPEE